MASPMQSKNRTSLVQSENHQQQNRENNVDVNVNEFAAKYKSKRGKYPGRESKGINFEKGASTSLTELRLKDTAPYNELI